MHACLNACALTLVTGVIPPMAAEFAVDIEQSLQQLSAVNERMESTAIPLNSLSLYWT